MLVIIYCFHVRAYVLLTVETRQEEREIEGEKKCFYNGLTMKDFASIVHVSCSSGSPFINIFFGSYKISSYIYNGKGGQTNIKKFLRFRS